MGKIDSFFIGIIVGAFVMGIVMEILDTMHPKPSAIDVYRNNTTLQITYKDSTPVDTIVVFK